MEISFYNLERGMIKTIFLTKGALMLFMYNHVETKNYFRGNITNFSRVIVLIIFSHTKIDKGGKKMGRGKAFNHKKKGHEPTLPDNAIIHKDINEHTVEEEELPVVKEAYKNSLRKG
jgi:hypothetical protein